MNKSKRVITEIDPRQIVLDYHPYERVLEFVCYIKAGGTFRPVKIQLIDGRYHIKDGRHRVVAARLLGMKIPVKVVQ